MTAFTEFLGESIIRTALHRTLLRAVDCWSESFPMLPDQHLEELAKIPLTFGTGMPRKSEPKTNQRSHMHAS